MRHLIRSCSLAVALCTALVSAGAHATDAVEKHLLSVLSQRFPSVKVDAVEPSPVPGLYAVIAGNDVVYVDASGDHMINGNMLDTRTKRNLSEEVVDAHYAIDFKSLPFGEAIKIVKGNGARKLAMFEDPDCPYCRRLEQADLQPLTNLTIYLFLFPLPSLHPNALADSKAIWCSPDRASAWTDWMLSKNWMLTRTPIPAGGSCADDPIAKIQKLAQKLHVSATPTLFLENGHRIGGFIPRKQLEQLIAQASQPSQPKAVPN